MTTDPPPFPDPIDAWLRDVERRLEPLPDTDRTELMDDLRGHFADALAAGQSPREAILRLGTPAHVAEQGFQQYQQRTGTDPRPRYLGGKRLWQIIALALVAAAILAVLAIPGAVSVSSDSTGHQEVATATVLEATGPQILAILAIPLALAAAPLLIWGRAWQPASIVVTVLLGAFALVSSASIGWYLLPALIAETIASCLPTQTHHTPPETHNQPRETH